MVPSWETDWGKMKSKKTTPATLKDCDCAVILADHDDFEMNAIVRHSPLIVDTRNATRNLSQKKVIRL
jgi:UDP-N-acetyl-D-glucosamine dehydrogenase